MEKQSSPIYKEAGPYCDKEGLGSGLGSHIVTARGNEHKAVFKSQRDRERFLEYLESATERYGAAIHVYCLMDNHYHILLYQYVGLTPFFFQDLVDTKRRWKTHSV